mgnify:FL=1
MNSTYVSPSWKRSNPNTQNHIGIGTSTQVDIEVHWPSGFEKSQSFTNVEVNKSHKITYKQSAVDLISVWSPGNGY